MREIEWKILHPQFNFHMLGWIPLWIDQDNPAPVAQQIHKHYIHGGGWEPFKGFTLHQDNVLTYPGDPPMAPLAEARLRDELVLFYPHSWVAVVQPDRSFEIARID